MSLSTLSSILIGLGVTGAFFLGKAFLGEAFLEAVFLDSKRKARMLRVDYEAQVRS